MWPKKFQNKTNGVTPRRWIRFCNPDLSDIITKWIGTEDWVLNTEKLAELREVRVSRNLVRVLHIYNLCSTFVIVTYLSELFDFMVVCG